MENKNILDIFYNHFIKEAALGNIDCYFHYKINFQTFIMEEQLLYESQTHNEELLIPTLEINNKKEFDQLLVTYINKALEFYDDDSYCDEVLSGECWNDQTKICKEKVIMSFLWANATTEDFKNPCLFLRKRIDFIEPYSNPSYRDFGYSEVLDSNLKVSIEKEKLNLEAPYKFAITLTNKKDDLELPRIRFGISHNEIYIYAIQHEKWYKEKQSKSINRKVYKINGSFNDESLGELAPSFLLAAYIFITYMKSLGYENYHVINYLPIRYNSKKVYYINKIEQSENKEKDYQEYSNKLIDVQTHITDKLVFLFLRLSEQYKLLEITSIPYEQEQNMTFKAIEDILCETLLTIELNELIVGNNITLK